MDSWEDEVRRYLWLSHGHDSLYGDDGEMQCAMCLAVRQAHDYRRDPIPALIESHEVSLRALRERDEKATAGLLEMIALLRMKYGEADDPRLPAGPAQEIYEAGLREAREGC